MPTAQGENPPAGLVAGITLPIERSFPTHLPDSIPAVSEPEFGPRICVVRHKLQILVARDISVCDPERLQVNLVERCLVIKAKVEMVRRALRMTNFSQAVAAFQLVPEKNFRRIYEAKRGIVDLQVPYQWGQANILVAAGSEIVSLAVSDDLLDIHGRWKPIEGNVLRIDDTDTIPTKEPTAYLGLQEQLDWNELTLLRDSERQIEEI
jgi:hypothetical protein